MGSGLLREEPVALSRLIDLVNERFGTDFTAADQLFFDQIIAAAMKDDALKQAAKANPEDKFALVFGNLLETLFIERMDQNEEIFARYMNDPAFQALVAQWLSDISKDIDEICRRTLTRICGDQALIDQFNASKKDLDDYFLKTSFGADGTQSAEASTLPQTST